MIRANIDTSSAQAMLKGLSQDLGEKAVAIAVDKTARSLQGMMKKDASIFSAVTTKTKNRWTWETYGRIPRAINVSKLFKRGKDFVKGDRGRKIYVKVGKNALESKRAPHAHLVMLPHVKWIPTGIPGKGQVRLAKRQDTPARPIFDATLARAQGMLDKNLKEAIKKVIKSVGG